MDKINDFGFNKYSQFGEDGIIQEIFQRMNSSGKICVEFGAWDGLHLSNTCMLWKDQGWTAYLIEGEKYKYEKLCTNTEEFSNVHAIHRFVSHEGKHRLDNILKENRIDDQFGCLPVLALTDSGQAIGRIGGSHHAG